MKKKELTTTQVILFGFLIAIAIGMFLLSLPISNKSGQWTNPIDALFTATTSVCVTGLVVVDTYSYWSTFGHVVMLLLIQCGGLGIVAFTTIFTIIVGQKVTLKGKLLIEDAFNLKTMAGLIEFLKFVFAGTFIVEAIGAIGYSFVFIPEYGAKGIWISVFVAISAFCNAGIDIIGDSSLMPYVSNVIVNIVSMFLIIMGSLGFIVWYDILKVIKEKKWSFAKLNLHSKIVLVTTFVLIFVGAVVTFAFEYGNPETLGPLNIPQKIMASLFQSITLRTAGFLTISQKALRDATATVCLFIMFVGGSPAGTAGGVKTATVAVIFLAAWSCAKGEDEVTVFNKTIPLHTLRKGLAVVTFSAIATITAIVLMLAFNGGDFLDVCYETVSAVATVGLSRNFTAGLGTAGKIIIICCMYLGRVGPISMATAFSKQSGNKLVKFATEDITVG